MTAFKYLKSRYWGIWIIITSSLFNLGCSAGPKMYMAKTDLFEAGKGGYATYRIPAIVVTPKASVLAFTEARLNSRSDWANIDIMMRRSDDGGKTWQPPRKIIDEGDKTVNNFVPIVDEQTGDLHFVYCVNYGRCFYMCSKDDGKTFSKPVEITYVFEKFKPEYNWTVIATGPGHGLQLKNGRLLIPSWLCDGGGKNHRPSCVATIYSDDHGKTWERGEIIVNNGEEVKNPSETIAVELNDGRIMLNIRSESKEYLRLLSYSRDGATNWTKPVFDNELYEPICMASILRLSRKPKSGKNRIIFANPDSRYTKNVIRKQWGARPRENVSVKLSYDEGETWPVSKVIDPGISGYSDLALGPDGSIYCLYERGGDKGFAYGYLTVARFNLAWLTDGADDLSL